MVVFTEGRVIMRDILFKGKVIISEEWVEGSLVILSENDYRIVTKYDLECAYTSGIIYDGDMTRVDPSTICQYTGLTDKNGNKIWENDIVSFLDFYCTDNGYAESWCIGKVLWDEETVSFQVTERLSAESYEVLGDCKVIGNIFDNPELLKGE